jgi:outer membrane protein OmpA-like peptidoglycan-associated protein
MKKVSLLLVLVFAAVTTFAQTSGFSTKAGYKSTFADNGFWDNWFIGVGASANKVIGDDNIGNGVGFFKGISVSPTLQVGKWINPYMGGRLKLQGVVGDLKNLVGNDWKNNKYVAGEVDFLFDVTNYLGKYNESRLYSLIPYLGVGFAEGWKYETPGGKQRNFTINGGLINKFRLTDRIAVDIDLSGMLLKEAFNHAGSDTYDGLAAASASLVFKLGKKTDFSEALLMDQGLIDDLNNQINRLRQENNDLSKRPVSCPECAKCPEAPKAESPKGEGPKTFVSNVVFFRLGSAVIDKNQEVSIYNTAKYLQDNPSKNVKVVGYADKKTGTASINMKLSEKRAKNVANALINKYNINSNRVKVEWKGDTEQPYAENAWNRVAIFFAE